MKIKLEEYTKAHSEGVRILKKGGIIVFPTDTVYGMGGDATNEKVAERIYEIKQREGKPLAVIMSGLDMIMKWCELYEESGKIIMEYLPGPYTFILKLKKGKTLACQKEKIGVRVPNHFFLRKLVENFGKPIIATSANISGEKDAICFEEIDKRILKAMDLGIDGGKTVLEQASTVVDLVDRKILRKGAGEFAFK